MSKPRLVLFLADIEGNLTALRQTLTRACEEANVSPPQVHWAEAASHLAEAGWRVAELKLTSSRGRAAPEDHLDALVRAVARDFRDQAMGLYVDPAGSYGRACFSEPGRPSLSVEGEYLDVLRKVARWLGLKPALLGNLLGGGTSAGRNLLAAAVDFGGEAPAGRKQPPPSSEPDEDDRFVEAKLAEARRLMDQYLGGRK